MRSTSLIKTSALAATLTLCASMTFAAHAELNDKQAKNAVEFRQSLFQLVKSNVGAFGAMAKGEMPIDEALIEKNATRLHQLSLMIPDYFNADTRNNDVQTKTLDKVWTDKADFDNKAQALTDKAQTLLTSVQNKDSDAYVKNMRAIFGTCKACHDDYKAE